MHTPLAAALSISLTFLLPSVFAVPSQRRQDFSKEDLPPAVWQMCAGGPDTTIIDSSAPVQEFEGVILTTGSCINNGTASPVPIPTSSGESEDIEPSFGIMSEDDFAVDDSCPKANNECLSRFSSVFPSNWVPQSWVPKCGASCTSTCYGINTGGPGPDPNHCSRIFAAMRARADQVFTLEPDNFLLYTVGTCGTGIQNQIAAHPTNKACSQKMIYDYADWAAVGDYLAWNCQAAQGARGGKCVGDKGIYTNIPDFYIQVYRN